MRIRTILFSAFALVAIAPAVFFVLLPGSQALARQIEEVSGRHLPTAGNVNLTPQSYDNDVRVVVTYPAQVAISGMDGTPADRAGTRTGSGGTVAQALDDSAAGAHAQKYLALAAILAGLSGVAMIAWLIRGICNRPIRRLADTVKNTARGNLDVRVNNLPWPRTRELTDLASSFNGLLDFVQNNTELFRSVFNQAAVGILLSGPDRRIVQANQKLCEFLGYEPEELAGRTLRDATHPDFVPQMDEQIRKLIDGDGESATIEILYQRNDGATVWGEWTSSLVRDEAGEPKFFISIIQNIDDRKRAEAEAREVAELLANSQRIAHLGSWDLDIVEDKERWSDEVYRIFGLEPQSVDFTGYGFLEYVHPEDREKARAAQDIAIAQHKPYSVEYRLIRPDGVERTVYEYAELEFDDAGRAVRLSGTIQDITERRQAELALRRTTKRLTEAQRLAHVGHWEWDPDSDSSEWSDETFRIFGLAPKDNVPTHHGFLDSIIHGSDRAMIEQAMEETLRTGEPYTLEFRIVRPDGDVRTVREICERYTPGRKDRPRLRGVLQDITELKQAEANLRETSRRLQLAQKQAKVGYWRWSFAEERLTYWSEEAARLRRYTAKENSLGYDEIMATIHPDDWSRVAAEYAAADAEPRDFSVEYRVAHDDGTITHIREIGEVEYDEQGKPVGHVGFVQDITELKRTETNLRETSRRLELAQKQAKVGYWRWSFAEERLTYWSEDAARLSQFPLQQGVLGYEEILARVHPDDRPHVEAVYAAADAEPRDFSMEYRVVHDDGRTTHIREIGEVEYDEHGKPVGHVGFVQDITELKLMEEELRKSEQRLNAFFTEAPAGLALYDASGRFIKVNETLARVAGITSMAHVGKRPSEILHPEWARQIEDANRRVLDTGIPQVNVEMHVPLPMDGGEIGHFVYSRFPIPGPDGRPVGVGSVLVDITDHKRAEDELRQAQKMEAVGQLTGGIAHDFNNLLAIVLGNLELVENSLAPGDDNRRQLQTALRATERGAELTRRLLAFSRKQALRPAPVDAKELIDGTLDLLRRSLGETVEIEIVADAGLWTTEVDPGQLETALVNLAINARDAMPDGGKLTIRASNARLTSRDAAARVGVTPGGYVLVSVTDTGTGMTPNTRERAFDPFFTTKTAGKGTGLGLSMVHGFVKQSGGHIEIDSTADEGTTVRLYIPQYRGAKAVAKRHGNGAEAVSGEGEVILVVEDDPDLRCMTSNMLQSLGYGVLEAGSAKRALEVLDTTPRVSLLLTDVVLPGGMSGRGLADRTRKKGLALPVLYMSGYTDDAVVHNGRLDDGARLLEKPFRKASLAQAVREALEIRSG